MACPFLSVVVPVRGEVAVDFRMMMVVSALQVLVGMLVRVGVFGAVVVLVGVFAAIMSTGVVCINVCSANISVDIYKDRIKPDAPDRKARPRSPTEVGYPAGLPVSIPRNRRK